MSPSCIHFNKIKCFVYHEMWTDHVLCFRINGMDIISSEKQPKTYFPGRDHSIKTRTKQLFDDIKYFRVICTFLIVSNNVGTLVSLLKQIKVFGNQIGLNKKLLNL